MDIPWVFITSSTIVTFIILLIFVRWIGSTQLTQLTFFNWVAGASMGNLAANMMAATDLQSWISSSYSLFLFTFSTIAAAYIALKSRWFRRVANGEPIVLIHKGILLRENLRKTKVNLDVLFMMLREKGYFSYSEIEYGILEPTGNLSILPIQEAQSVSKADLIKGPDLSGKGQGPFIELVVDGEIDQDKMRSTGHDEKWLKEQIRKHGGRGLKDVMFLAVNQEGEIIIDLHRLSKDGNPGYRK